MQRVDADLPDALLAVLPSDPFDQLDIARRLAAAAYQKRLNQGGSNERVRELERALQDASAKLAQSIEEQAKVTAERNALVATVKKLNRDVAKLETFKRTLMQQLQDGDEEDTPGSGAKAQQSLQEMRSATRILAQNSGAQSESDPSDDSSQVATPRVPSRMGSMSAASAPEPRSLPSPRGSVHLQGHGEVESSGGPPPPIKTPTAAWMLRTRTPSRTPSMTPLYSPHLTPSATPTTASQPGSPRARQSRVDGKEFFRQARNRLTYEQFSAFLVNIKQLNAHHQSREETLRKADEIFGPDKKDLYISFEGLLSRHLPT